MKTRLILCLAAASLASCRPAAPPPAPPAPPPDTLAKVGNVAISASEFAALAAQRHCPDTPEARTALLDEMIEEETLVQRARAVGLDQTPAFRQAMRRYLTARLDEQELQPLLARAESVPDAELDAACREAVPRFTAPAARRYAWIRIDTDAAGKADALNRLQEASQKYQSLPPDPARIGFGTIAAAYSDDNDTRYQGGDLGWHSLSPSPAHLPSPALSLADGLITEPCDVPGGVAIIMATGTRSATAPSPESLRGKIRYELLNARRASITSEWKTVIRNAIPIETFSEVLRTAPFPPAPEPQGQHSGRQISVSRLQ